MRTAMLLRLAYSNAMYDAQMQYSLLVVDVFIVVCVQWHRNGFTSAGMVK